MKALRSFSVRPTLPEPLAPLERLAMNLRWSWDERTRDLFRWVDPEAWDANQHDPVRLLATVAPERLQALAADQAFLGYLTEIDDELTRYLSQPRWFQSARADSPLGLVGYFSPEFGISEALPQYSGGLGVLAGDHLKASSDLGVPLVGIGLFYGHGYFRQSLSLNGWQQERYPELDPYTMAIRLCDDITVTVELGGETCVCQVWRADVGRTPLYLLDTDVEANPPHLRQVTDRLYGGDTEHRLQQEIVLGVGGVRALQAIGLAVQVFHTNEGHAGFLGLERIRQLVQQGQSFTEALEAARAGNIFTTHTPVPGRHRPLPARAHEALLRRLRPRDGRHLRGPDAARPARRRARRDPLQHGGDGVAPRRPGQRRGQAARRREPVDVRRALARRPRRRGAHHLHHQRRARPHVGGARDRRAAVALRPPRLGRGQRGRLGPGRRHP